VAYHAAGAHAMRQRCASLASKCVLVLVSMSVLAWLLWEAWLLPSGLVVVLQAGNLGNQMSRLTYAIYKRHSYGHRHLYVLCTSKATIPMLRSLHMRQLRWASADIRGEVSPTIMQATNEFRFWSAGYHPYAVGGVLQAALTLPPAPPDIDDALVIHFRASDAPFDRNPSYAFLKDAFYERAVKAMGTVAHVVVLHCVGHYDPPNRTASLTLSEVHQLVPKYVAHMTALMGRLRPYTPITVHCHSVEDDFATMLYARYFIGSTSSMSMFAALLRGARPSVLPEPPVAWATPSGTSHVDFFATPARLLGTEYLHSSGGATDGYRLEQAQVADYRDVTTVLKQLSQPVVPEL